MPNIQLTKTDNSLLLPISKYITGLILPFVPEWVKPNYITFLKFFACIIASAFFYLASFNSLWLLFIPLPLLMYWLMDHLDGAVARSRNQTSDQGFFLDLFLDSSGFTFINLGIAFASYTLFQIWAILLILILLQTILIMFWVILKEQFILPTIGGDEGIFILIFISILTFYFPNPIIQIGGYDLVLFDLVGALLAILSSWEIIKSAFELYQKLDPDYLNN